MRGSVTKAAAALAAAATLLGCPSKERSGGAPPPPAEEKRLLDLDRAEVVRGEVTAGGVTSKFAWADERWTVVSADKPCPADRAAIDRALDALSSLKGRAVEEAPKAPRLRIALELRSGEKVDVAAGGPAEDGRTIVSAGGKSVATADERLAAIEQAGARGLCDRRPFPLRVEEVASFEVYRKGSLVYRLAKEGEIFRVTDQAGAGGTAAPGKVGQLLQLVVEKLAITREVGFVAEKDKEQLVRLALDPPAFELRVRGPRNEELRLDVGDVPPGGGARAVRVPDTGRTGMASEELAQILDPPVSSLRDQELSTVDTSKATRVVVWNGGEVFEIVRAEKGWALGTATGPAVKDARVAELLSIAAGGADRIEKEGPTPEEMRAFGLDPPSRRVLVTNKAGEVLADLRIGMTNGAGLVYVAGLGVKPKVGATASARFDALPRSKDDLVR